jgi:hypothetical protein
MCYKDSPKGTGRKGVEDARLVRLWVGKSDDPGRLLLLEVGHQVPVYSSFSSHWSTGKVQANVHYQSTNANICVLVQDPAH